MLSLPSDVIQQDIKNRYRKQLEIDCDDIFEYKRDEDFMNNVKRNSMRYVQFFEKAATEILEGMIVDAADIHAKQDVFDIIYEQRKATLIKAARGEHAVLHLLPALARALARFGVVPLLVRVHRVLLPGPRLERAALRAALVGRLGARGRP